MKISNLKEETKLMWDASPDTYPGTDKVIIHPVIVGYNNRHKNKNKMLKMGMVLICFGQYNCQWMGPEEKYLREPTKEELETLKWPEL